MRHGRIYEWAVLQQAANLKLPAWQPVRGRQAVGRGLRFDSHTGLPADLQTMKVQRFLSRQPLGLLSRLASSLGFNKERETWATDDYLANLAKQKENLNAQVE